MVVFYHGYRNVLKGRNANDSVHPYKGVGTYSNWDIFNTSHVLDGAPNNDHAIGTGRHPHGLKLSRLYKGLENAEQPLDGPGAGARLEGFRFHPWENKAAGNNLVFKANYGHAPGTPVQGEEQYGIADWTFNGVTTKSLSGSFGHTQRETDATGTANTFGTHKINLPSFYKVGPQPIQDPGNDIVFDQSTNKYAHQQVNIWRGVTSSKALSV